MSWSKTFSGKRAVILAALASVGAEVKANDEQYGQPTDASARMIELHQQQVAKAVSAAEAFMADAPDGHEFSVSINGHASVGNDGVTSSDQYSVSLSAYKPARPQVSAGSD